MVVSNSHQFVFLRIPKNASSSLATYFVNLYCNNKDIYTEVNDGGIAHNNIPKNIIDENKQHSHFIHLTLQELRNYELISNEMIKKYKIIGVIRNPFERQMSLYNFLCNNCGKIPTKENFNSEFITGKHINDVNNSYTQCEYMKIDGKLVGEFWVYDNLQKHVSDFSKKHGKDDKLLHLKNFSTSTKERMNYYTEKTKSAVRKYYEEDFEKYYELTGIEL